MRHVVAFHEIDHDFGGAEEGGWRYDTGPLVRLHRMFATEPAAWRAANRANLLLFQLHRRLLLVDFAAKRGGRDPAKVFSHIPPEHISDAPPRYA